MPERSLWLPSLRVRITVAMLAIAAVGGSIVSASVFIAAARLERSVLNRHVQAEFDTLARRASEEPNLEQVHSTLLTGYVGRDNPNLPPELAALPLGTHHAVDVGDHSFQVYVGNAGARTLFVAYDITEWEALERPVVGILVAGVVLGVLLAIVLGFWTSAGVIRPVTALSERLRTLDPRLRHVRLGNAFGGEVSAIARSFDRYMERLDGFVAREQLFTGAAAHELRTPLAVIQGATEVLAEQRDMPPAAERATRRLERAIREMREFIEALLFLSREERLDAGEQARCEIGRIVRELAEDYRTLHAQKPLAWSVKVTGELWLDVAPALPAIVIGNLLRNAVEHTQEGRISIMLASGMLRITDTGPGIPQEARAKLFHSSYTTKPGGGMGLHLVKRICDRFGWHIDVASEASVGTTISIDFTASRQTEPVNTPRRALV